MLSNHQNLLKDAGPVMHQEWVLLHSNSYMKIPNPPGLLDLQVARTDAIADTNSLCP